jgi:hypothetical protein
VVGLQDANFPDPDRTLIGWNKPIAARAVPTLHPQIEQVLKEMVEAKLRPIEEMSPAEARQQMEATARVGKGEPLPVAKVEERLIPAAAGRDPAARLPAAGDSAGVGDSLFSRGRPRHR